MTAEDSSPRFRSPEAALRFYFRASELLGDKTKPGLFSHKSSTRTAPRHPNAIVDFLTLDSCFSELNEVEIWLLRELYGPTCFGWTQRKLAELYKEARERFPNLQWTPQMVSRFKQRALTLIEERLKRSNLI
jgi:hypothetical protein